MLYLCPALHVVLLMCHAFAHVRYVLREFLIHLLGVIGVCNFILTELSGVSTVNRACSG